MKIILVLLVSLIAAGTVLNIMEQRANGYPSDWTMYLAAFVAWPLGLLDSLP